MKHFTKDGDQLWKSVEIKVFAPGFKKLSREVIRSAKGKGFSSEAIDELLAKIAEKLDKNFPECEFRLVTLAPNRFNFICIGERNAEVANAA